MKVCPVCNRAGLNDTDLTCPQCNADLECFQLLKSLPEGNPQSLPKKTISIMIFGILVALVLGGWTLLDHLQLVARFDAMQQALPEDTSQEMATTLTKIDQFTDRMILLEQQVFTLWTTRPLPVTQEQQPTPKDDDSNRFFLYAIQSNSTLWGIAQKFYGHGLLYAILLEQNPDFGILISPKSGQIRILKEKNTAIALFDQFSWKEKGHTYYRYKVNPKESWEDIAWKFYGTRNRANELRAWNPNKELIDNERINVLLD